jgi:hypothetical protein
MVWMLDEVVDGEELQSEILVLGDEVRRESEPGGGLLVRRQVRWGELLEL